MPPAVPRRDPASLAKKPEPIELHIAFMDFGAAAAVMMPDVLREFRRDGPSVNDTVARAELGNLGGILSTNPKINVLVTRQPWDYIVALFEKFGATLKDRNILVVSDTVFTDLAVTAVFPNLPSAAVLKATHPFEDFNITKKGGLPGLCRFLENELRARQSQREGRK